MAVMEEEEDGEDTDQEMISNHVSKINPDNLSQISPDNLSQINIDNLSKSPEDNLSNMKKVLLINLYLPDSQEETLKNLMQNKYFF